MATKKKAAKSPAEPAPDKLAAASAKPAKKAAPKAPDKPAAKPPEKVVEKPTGKAPDKFVEKPTTKTAEKIVEKPAAKAKPPAAKPPQKAATPKEEAKVEPRADAKSAPKAAPPREAAAKKEAAPPATKARTAPLAKAAPPPRPRAASTDDDYDTDDDDDEEDEEEAEEKEEGSDADADEAPRAAVAEAEEAPPEPKKVVRRTIPPLPPRKPGVITVAFSPDADDAFMLYGIVSGKVDTEGRKYEFVRGDIAALNAESQKGTYDVTAFSFGAWPTVVDRYLALPCGGSFGDQTGPVVVSKTPVRSGEVHGLTVAVPGRTTTAALVLRMWLHPNKLNLVEVPFQQVALAVKSGQVRAGLLIHEGQLTYKADGLTRVMDLGLWWGERTEGLPLPLGGTGVRRDIPPEEREKIALDLKRSIAYALGHREQALDYAMPFARGLARPLLDKYIATYVSELTLDYGERGRQAVKTLFDEAARLGHMPDRADLEFS